MSFASKQYALETVTLQKKEASPKLERVHVIPTDPMIPIRSTTRQQHACYHHAYAKRPSPRSIPLPILPQIPPRISPVPCQNGILREPIKRRADSFIRSDFARRYQKERATCAGAEQINAALQEIPVLGYYTKQERTVHNRNFSAPEQQRHIRFKQNTPPRPSRPRAKSSATTSQRPPIRLLPPPPILQRSPPSEKSRRSRRPCSAVPLSLFPVSSPTNSLEMSRSMRTVSSPGSMGRSSILAPRVSVFDEDDEDDDEKIGLLEYLKWPLQATRSDSRKFNHDRRVTQMAVNTWNWKWLLCC
jgi:hypothetical protein